MNKDKVQILKASLEDIPALSELLSELFAQEAEFEPSPAIQGRGLEQIIKNPKVGLIYVAKVENRIVGMVNLLLTVSTALGSKVALLEDMIVTQEYRCKGIGTGLIKAAIDEAKSMGCKRITLLTDKNNKFAQRFYQRSGFVESEMMPMRLIFPEDK